MKVDLTEVEQTLLQKKIEPPKVADIIAELTKIVEELKEENKANALPKLKWEYAIILFDKTGELKDKEFVGWVVQQKDGEDMGQILSKLSDAAKSQNETAKTKKTKISCLVDLFEHLKSKFTKEKNLKIKTKELTRVLIATDKL